MYRLATTVKANVAGFCDWCGKFCDQIALEILAEYLWASAYETETMRDRGERSSMALTEPCSRSKVRDCHNLKVVLVPWNRCERRTKGDKLA